MTPFRCFVEKWKNGCGSTNCAAALKVVMCRGKVPCDVLFVGEAPGESEDCLGVPFVGPAGKLLDRIIRNSVPDTLRCALTNLVCCIPRNPDEGNKADEPLPEDILTCAPRLREFVALCKPQLIVTVGSIARDYLDTKLKGNVWTGYSGIEPRKSSTLQTRDPHANVNRVHVLHPAFIIRQNVAKRGLLIQEAEVNIATAIQEVFNGG